ncbi:MAG TPA: trypsin-like peptidase domain-containing protein [Acidimicrobiales bacterium]
MEPDDELDDEGSSGPLLPPDDRLWRHPSELAQAAGAPAVSVRAENRVWTVALLSGVIGALLATGVVYAVGGVRTRKITVAALEQDVDSSPVVTLTSTGSPSRFVTGAEHVRPSCVVLTAHDAHGTRVTNGVVFRSDGMVITTAHMLAGAQTLSAVVGGTRRVAARLVAVDPGSDLAVVKLTGSGFIPAPLGSALALKVGDPVIAVHPPDATGAPAGVPGDQGSVSGLGQTLVSAGGAGMADLVRIETTEAPSAVGGPVVDAHGAVVAFGTALGAPGQAVEYAVPVDLARGIATQLLAGGRVVPVWLGVQGTDLAGPVATAMGVPGGAVVQRVYPASPAAIAGVRGGDVVVGIDGRVVTSMANLIMAIHGEPPGTHVELDIDRADGQRTMTAEVAPRPAGVT